MKTAKSYKIITLLIAFVLAITASLVLMQGTVAKADSTPSLSTSDFAKYFSLNDSDLTAENLGGSNLSLTVSASGDQFKIKNKIAINDFSIKMSASDIKNAKFIFVSDSYNAKFDKSADKTVTNEFTFNSSEIEQVISFKTVDGIITPTVGATAGTPSTNKIAGNDKFIANLSIEFELEEETTPGSVDIEYLSQGSDSYKQTFVVNSDTISLAYPRADIYEGINFNAEGKLNAIKGRRYQLKISSYSIVGENTTTYVVETPNVLPEKVSEPTAVSFYSNDGTLTVRNNAFASVEKYDFVTIDSKDVSEAPKYNDIDSIRTAFETELKENVIKEDGHFVRLGKSITIPSDYFKKMVSDGVYLFEDLTHTIYYKTPTSDNGQTSGWTITLTGAGDYEFFVVFKNPSDKAMDKDDFYKIDVDDENEIDPGEYYDYVFKFTIDDDADMSVTPPTSIPNWYTGVEYKGAEFSIAASGYSPKYKLEYNAKIDAVDSDEGWVEIPKFASVSDNYEGENYNYEELKAINYDGQVTFTPDKVGAYRITCSVNSTQSTKNSSASIIVKVDKQATNVKPASHWVENNIWSVVFLGVGTLCLIGIIVLLLIKPKDTVEDDE